MKNVYTSCKSNSKLLFITLLFLFIGISALSAQTVGDYRSVANGKWSVLATWQRWDGTSWVKPTTTPTIKDNVTVQSSHIVTIESTPAQAYSLTANGTLINRASITTTGAIVFNEGSTYRHDRDGGIIPAATWNLSSNCIITGITTSPSAAFQSSLAQSFGNFQWNCDQNVNVSFDGKLTDVKGNLTISGGNSVALGGTSGNLTVGGNFTQTDGNFIVSNSAARTISVAGNFTVSGGTFNLSSGSNNTVVNVAKNFTFTGGTITVTGTSTNSIINFNGTDVQTFVSGGTLKNKVNFAILSGAIVDFGTSVISSGSTGNFTLNNEGSIKTANPGGITTSGAVGSIQLTGTRTYSDGANYEYNGASMQNTGSGLAQNKPGMVIISNSKGVTFTENTEMSYLVIESGSFVNLGAVSSSNGDHKATGLLLGEKAFDRNRFGGAGSGLVSPNLIRTDYFGPNTGILTLTSGTPLPTVSDTKDIIIPCGVTSVDVEVWGGGGAGASRTSSGKGGGGGGGAYSRKENIPVTTGETYTVTVGRGASPGNSAGGDSYFNLKTTPQTHLVKAKGGNSATSDSSTGAAGGSASAGIGDIKFSGGNGANGGSYGGGGGGSSAGSAANGANASNSSGATAPANGGNGGDGKDWFLSGDGSVGVSPGGGGGGAYMFIIDGNGGNGGKGQLNITYHYNPAIIPGAIQPVCQGITSVSLPYSLTNCLIPDKYIIIYSNEAQAAGFVNVILEPLTGSPIALTVPADASAGSYQGSIIGWDKETNSFGNPQPITVTINESIWTGLTDTDWNKPGNWSCNLVPTKYSNVTIPVVANLPVIELTSGTYPVAECKSITINSGAKLTIKGSLTVYNKMNNNAGVDGLIIKSGEGVANVPNGSLIFKKPDVNNAVPATVEMYSIAFRDAAATTNKYKWQFFGVPVTSVTASPTFDGSWVRYYDETGVGQFDKWKYVTNGDVLTPFTGYEITQDVGKKIIFQGNLVVGSKTISLPRTSGVYNSGYYILSNSYTSGIEIKNITFTNIEETIYIYNTGSFTDWENHLNTSGTAPGQYWSVPKNTAPTLYPAISSMQGFMIKPIGASGPGSIQYKYEANNINVTKNTNPQLVKKSSIPGGTVDDAQLKDSIPPGSPQLSYMTVDVTGQNGRDRVWLFSEPGTSPEYDNGWDGPKIIASSGLNLYADEETGDYQVNTTDDLNGRVLALRAGVGTEYTLIINKTNLSGYETLYLTDLVTGIETDLSTADSISYSFTAANTESFDKRFMLSRISKVFTGNEDVDKATVKIYGVEKTIRIQNSGNEIGMVQLFDVTGKQIYSGIYQANATTEIKTGLQPGVYLVNVKSAGISQHKTVLIHP